MVLGKDTNIVYFSKLLRDSNEQVFDQLAAILTKHSIPFTLIDETKDIWCRDYMPVQINQNEFVQFRYEPSYLRYDINLQSDPKRICKVNGLKPIYSSINLDGGNIVNWSDRAIITDRVFDENPDYGSKSKLIHEIEELLRVELIVIPQIKSDVTGHADGLVRFLDRQTILGNDRELEFKYWGKGIDKILKENGIEFIDIPFFDYKNRKYPNNAIGCYLNFLEVGNLIVLPMFNLNGNRDQEVYDMIRQIYSGREIETIDYNEIGLHGGLLNCTTWTVKN